MGTCSNCLGRFLLVCVENLRICVYREMWSAECSENAADGSPETSRVMTLIVHDWWLRNNNIYILWSIVSAPPSQERLRWTFWIDGRSRISLNTITIIIILLILRVDRITVKWSMQCVGPKVEAIVPAIRTLTSPSTRSQQMPELPDSVSLLHNSSPSPWCLVPASPPPGTHNHYRILQHHLHCTIVQQIEFGKLYIHFDILF